MPTFFSLFNQPRVSIPAELASQEALLSYLEVQPKELKKIWWFRRRMYNLFELPKGKNKVRVIHAPNDRLKHLQRKLVPLLEQLYRVRNPVHGFVSNKSVKTNASAHLKRRFVLNVDIESFFPSITEKRVIGLLDALGVNGTVSRIIARISCYNGHLPQGAPTSPVISNMICFRLDKELISFAKKVRCIYTRYADDITLSSYQPMAAVFHETIPPAGHLSPDQLTENLRNIFTANGFTLNKDKVHYADKHSRRMVTGIKINEHLNVDRRYVRNIRASLYSAETLGIEKAQEKFKNEYNGDCDLGVFLQGKISWLRYIRGHSDPVFRAIAIRFNKIFPNRKIEIAPTITEVRDRAIWIVEHFEGEMSQGSAFFLKDVGLVTAAHCVKDAKEIEVYHPSKPANKFKVQVRNYCKDRDLAILDHDISPTEYFELNSSSASVAIGSQLTAVGYPDFGPGDGLNVRSGTVSSLPTKHGIKLIEVTQKLAQGMSGGPLTDANLGVVGIIHKGGPEEPRDFSVSISVLHSWIAEIKEAS